MKKILVEPHIDNIVMPENLKIGLMVSQQRQKCKGMMCPCDYVGFAFGQSPFPVPESLKSALATNVDKSHFHRRLHLDHCKYLGIFFTKCEIETLPRPAAIMERIPANITKSHSQPPCETKNPLSHLM